MKTLKGHNKIAKLIYYLLEKMSQVKQIKAMAANRAGQVPTFLAVPLTVSSNRLKSKV